MKYWEISGNLDDKVSGMKNYDVFEQTVCQIKTLYDAVFGLSLMNKVKFLVDNATDGSGYTPIVTKVLEEFFVIKLRIVPTSSQAEIAYQFSHELTHIVFHACCDKEKPQADEEEESICSAASLIILKTLYPQSFPSYMKHVLGLSNNGYRKGANLASEIHYDIYKLKIIIEEKSSRYNAA